MSEEGLRVRQQASNLSANEAFLDDAIAAEPVEEGEKEKKTFGRTPDGTSECRPFLPK